MDRARRLQLLYTASGCEFGELARRTGYPRSSLSAALTGRNFPRPARLKLLLDALGAPIEAVENDAACLRWIARLAGAEPTHTDSLTDDEREAVDVLRRSPELSRYLVTRMRADLELVLAQASQPARPAHGGGGGG